MASCENELQARPHERGFFGDALEELFENAIAVLIDDSSLSRT